MPAPDCEPVRHGGRPVLVLSRKLNQAIMIGDNVRIVVVAVDRDQVKLGIDAPREIPVHRFEVYEDIQRSNQAAAAGLPPSERPPQGKSGEPPAREATAAKLAPQKRPARPR